MAFVQTRLAPLDTAGNHKAFRAFGESQAKRASAPDLGQAESPPAGKHSERRIALSMASSRIAMASKIKAMASNLGAMGKEEEHIDQIAMASNLEAMGQELETIALCRSLHCMSMKVDPSMA